MLLILMNHCAPLFKSNSKVASEVDVVLYYITHLRFCINWRLARLYLSTLNWESLHRVITFPHPLSTFNPFTLTIILITSCSNCILSVKLRNHQMSSIVDAYCCCLLNLLEETSTLHVCKYKQFRQQSIPKSIVLVNTFFVRLKHIYVFMLFIPEDT